MRQPINILFLNYNIPQRPNLNSSLLPIVIKRGMKIAKAVVDKKNMIHHSISATKYLLGTPMSSPTDIHDRIVQYITDATLGEQIANQSIISNFFTKSIKKVDMIAAAKNGSDIYARPLNEKRILFENIDERAAPYFFNEFFVTCRFVQTHPSVKYVVMRSEFSPAHSYQSTPDINIVTATKVTPADIKLGNNMFKDFYGSLLGEIYYDQKGNLYQVLNNNKMTLNELQIERLKYLELRKNEEHFDELYNTMKAIQQDKNLSDFQKNTIIEESLLKFVDKNLIPYLKPSYYNTVIVREPEHYTISKELFDKALQYIDENPDFFINKKNSRLYIKKILYLCNEEYGNIYSNIDKSKAFWLGTGFEAIADDLFK